MKPAEGGSYVRNKDGSLTKAGALRDKPVKSAETETPADDGAAKKED